MTEIEILPVVKSEYRFDGERCITVDWLGQFALVGRCKDGVGVEHTWIKDDMTGVMVGDYLAVVSEPYNCKILGKVV